MRTKKTTFFTAVSIVFAVLVTPLVTTTSLPVQANPTFCIQAGVDNPTHPRDCGFWYEGENTIFRDGLINYYNSKTNTINQPNAEYLYDLSTDIPTAPLDQVYYVAGAPKVFTRFNDAVGDVNLLFAPSLSLGNSLREFSVSKQNTFDTAIANGDINPAGEVVMSFNTNYTSPGEFSSTPLPAGSIASHRFEFDLKESLYRRIQDWEVYRFDLIYNGDTLVRSTVSQIPDDLINYPAFNNAHATVSVTADAPSQPALNQGETAVFDGLVFTANVGPELTPESFEVNALTRDGFVPFGVAKCGYEGICTLNDALFDAAFNDTDITPTIDTITFDLPDGAPKAIRWTGGTVQDVILDGTTQLGPNGEPQVTFVGNTEFDLYDNVTMKGFNFAIQNPTTTTNGFDISVVGNNVAITDSRFGAEANFGVSQDQDLTSRNIVFDTSSPLTGPYTISNNAFFGTTRYAIQADIDGDIEVAGNSFGFDKFNPASTDYSDSQFILEHASINTTGGNAVISNNRFVLPTNTIMTSTAFSYSGFSGSTLNLADNKFGFDFNDNYLGADFQDGVSIDLEDSTANINNNDFAFENTDQDIFVDQRFGGVYNITNNTFNGSSEGYRVPNDDQSFASIWINNSHLNVGQGADNIINLNQNTFIGRDDEIISGAAVYDSPLEYQDCNNLAGLKVTGLGNNVYTGSIIPVYSDNRHALGVDDTGSYALYQDYNDAGDGDSCGGEYLNFAEVANDQAQLSDGQITFELTQDTDPANHAYPIEVFVYEGGPKVGDKSDLLDTITIDAANASNTIEHTFNVAANPGYIRLLSRDANGYESIMGPNVTVNEVTPEKTNVTIDFNNDVTGGQCSPAEGDDQIINPGEEYTCEFDLVPLDYTSSQYVLLNGVDRSGGLVLGLGSLTTAQNYQFCSIEVNQETGADYIRCSADGTNGGEATLAPQEVGEYPLYLQYGGMDPLIVEYPNIILTVVEQSTTEPETPVNPNPTFSPWTHRGAALSEVSMAVFDNKLFQTVRGTDNNIYTRYTEDGDNWSPWVPRGATFGNVTVEVFNGRLYQMVRGTDNNIYTRYTEDGDNWSPWVPRGATFGNISSTVFDNKLFQTVRGTDNNIYTRYTQDGDNWSPWVPRGATFGEVAMVADDSTIYQSVHGTDNGVYTRQSTDGISWSGWVRNSEASGDIRLHIHNGELYQTFIDRSGRAILRKQVDVNTWQTRIISSNAKGVPTMTTFGNDLLINVRDRDNTITAYTGNIDDGFSGTTAGASLSEVSTISFNDTFFQSVRGTNNLIYTRTIE